MARRLEDILKSADEIMHARQESGGTQKQASASFEDLDIFSMAETLRGGTSEVKPENFDVQSMNEKIASSVAVVDVLLNMPTLMKMAEFEKQAAEQGQSPEDIESFLEKTASSKMVSISSSIPLLAPFCE